jgi:hypothetical protein
MAEGEVNREQPQKKSGAACATPEGQVTVRVLRHVLRRRDFLLHEASEQDAASASAPVEVVASALEPAVAWEPAAAWEPVEAASDVALLAAWLVVAASGQVAEPVVARTGAAA